MIIAHVITRLLRAGSEENTINTCLSQAETGHEVMLIHGNEWNADQVARCTPHMEVIELKDMVHSISLRKDVLATRAMTALFKHRRPTIVHTHQSKAGIIGRVSARLAQVPVIVHGIHTVPFASVGRAQRLTYLAAERAVAGYTDAYVNVSEGTRQTYLDHAVGRADQHFVAHSGFDLHRFREAQFPEDWRTICGLDSADPKPSIILMLAALEDRKRHVPFLEVFERIRRRVPNAKLLLAGEGPMRESIVNTIARLRLEPHVKLLGFYPRPERLIALSDLTVLTSVREGLPRVFVQSLAGGRPVVSTALPGIEELVIDRVNGLITPVDDLRVTADAIADLLSDGDRLRWMQDHARCTDVSSWDTAAMCKTLAEIYERFVADGSGEPSYDGMPLNRGVRQERARKSASA